MVEPARYCIVFNVHQPPYDKRTMKYFEEAHEHSYRVHLDVLDDFPDMKVNLNITGTLLEVMNRKHPETIRRLAKKVDARQVYLTACGHTHPIFPILLEMIGKDACEKQIERDRHIKKELFGVEPCVFRLPEYAVSDAALRLLHEYGFDGTIVPDSVFPGRDSKMTHVMDCGLKLACRDNRLSDALAGHDYDKDRNYFRWMKEYGATPEMVADDFAANVGSEGRLLTDFDAETFNHWMIESRIPGDKMHVLRAVYGSLLDHGIEMMHLPEFMDSAPVKEAGNIPRVSYDKEGLSTWEGETGHASLWEDVKACWEMYGASGDETVLGLALRAQASDWFWAATKKYPVENREYPHWWLAQPGRCKNLIKQCI